MHERKFIPVETIRIRCGVSHDAYRLVDDVSRRTGTTLGALVDNALRQTYGKSNDEIAAHEGDKETGFDGTRK